MAENVENKVESVPLWLAVDQRLKVMFARAHKAGEQADAPSRRPPAARWSLRVRRNDT